ncbi:tyrosine-protein phosphatase [Robiginitomaculum antarcticum]|uniref:tyrosine-protein phosphatase n=1 Tax=Robiginitomaculum antarcticum TaxID=437507 RepID=UPI000360AD3A|nr:tyrosine-protein phosphatase [Robiginitomaculum antarcticum]
MPLMTQNRLLKFEQVLNMRDFGGYDGRFGHVNSGLLFRSAHLNNATPADLGRLREIDIRLIVDLRYLSERERQPNKWPAGHTARTLAFDASRTGQAPHEAFIQNDLRVAEDARQYMLSNYAARPGNASFQDIFRDTLTHMSGSGDAVLVHCAAGKDRTGTLVALIQSLLGMSDADIMDDYMLTMTAVDVDSFLSPAALMMEERFGRSYAPEALRPMFGVEPGYLKAALDNMGNAEDYARQTLGINEAQIAAIRNRYTVQA